MTKDELMQRVITEPSTGCWLWNSYTFSTKSGGRGKACHNGRKFSAHRLSYELFKGPIAKGMQVLHHCDVPLCVNPEHLFLGTQRDNVRDCVRKGRANHSAKGSDQRGSKNNRARLTDSQVREILSRSDEPLRRIAEQHGVSVANVCLIRRGKAWKHLQRAEV